jgi:hypothetical protein
MSLVQINNFSLIQFWKVIGRTLKVLADSPGGFNSAESALGRSCAADASREVVQRWLLDGLM